MLFYKQHFKRFCIQNICTYIFNSPVIRRGEHRLGLGLGSTLELFDDFMSISTCSIRIWMMSGWKGLAFSRFPPSFGLVKFYSKFNF